MPTTCGGVPFPVSRTENAAAVSDPPLRFRTRALKCSVIAARPTSRSTPLLLSIRGSMYPLYAWLSNWRFALFSTMVGGCGTGPVAMPLTVDGCPGFKQSYCHLSIARWRIGIESEVEERSPPEWIIDCRPSTTTVAHRGGPGRVAVVRLIVVFHRMKSLIADGSARASPES